MVLTSYVRLITRQYTAASLQTQITKLVAPGTLKVISENTFGPLSEKELVFAGTASNAISNYRLNK